MAALTTFIKLEALSESASYLVLINWNANRSEYRGIEYK